MHTPSEDRKPFQVSITRTWHRHLPIVVSTHRTLAAAIGRLGTYLDPRGKNFHSDVWRAMIRTPTGVLSYHQSHYRTRTRTHNDADAEPDTGPTPS